MAGSNKFTCVSCSFTAGGAPVWCQHILSKSHRKKTLVPYPDENHVRRFIYVSGPDIPPEHMAMYFLNFGLVRNVEKVIVKQKAPFYFVEFVDQKSADDARTVKRTEICGQPATISQRKATVTASNTLDAEGLLKSIMTAETLGSQLRLLLNYVEMTPQELRFREEFRNDLEAWFKQRVQPETQIYIFGSCRTGLGFKGADIDIFVDFGFSKAEEMSQKDQVKLCASHIRRIPGITQVRTIVNARVPIVKLFSKNMGVSIDISFRNAMSVKNSELIRWYVLSDHRIKEAMMVLRWWAKMFHVTASGRNAGGGFTNYAFSWLVLFYLMRLSDGKAIPNVRQLQRGRRQEIQGWNCAFNEHHPRPNLGNLTTYEIIHGFFRFFGSVDFGPFVICPLLGELIPRGIFGIPERLGDEFDDYKKVHHETGEVLNLKTPVCIQDPFELSFNISRSATRNGSRCFVVKCREAYRVCTLWTGLNELGSLYPLIYIALGSSKAVEVVRNHYDIPFPPSVGAPPTLPNGVSEVELGACSLSHAFAKSPAFNEENCVEAHVRFWQELVVCKVETILRQFLFMDTWRPDNLDEEQEDQLEKFIPTFLEMFQKEAEEAALIQNAEALKLEKPQDDAAMDVQQNSAAGSSKEENNDHKKAPLPDARTVLGQRYFGPLEPRHLRVERLMQSLKMELAKFRNPEVLAIFFCEVKYPTLFRKGLPAVPRASSRKAVASREILEKYATAHLLYNLTDPPTFELTTHPSRQFLLAVTKTVSPIGVRFISSEDATVAGEMIFSFSVSQRVKKALASYLEIALIAELDEADRLVVGDENCDENMMDES